MEKHKIYESTERQDVITNKINHKKFQIRRDKTCGGGKVGKFKVEYIYKLSAGCKYKITELEIVFFLFL